jgi:hypothetical protein
MTASTLDEHEQLASCPSRFTFRRVGGISGMQRTGGWVGPKISLDNGRDEKNLITIRNSPIKGILNQDPQSTTAWT